MIQRNLNIACIAADLIPEKLGGAELHVVEVIKHLALKHQIHLFVGSDTTIKTIFPPSVKVYPIKYPKIPNLYGFFYILFGFFQIKKTLKQINFNLLWAKQSYPQAPLAALLKQVFKNPLYITVQNPMLHQEELVLQGKLLKPFHSLITQLLTPLICCSFKKANLITAVSQYSARLAKKMGAKKIIVIPNGVDLSRFNQLKKTKNKIYTIISNSSLIPRNGIDTLIGAVALLPKNLNWQLLIAGDGPEASNLNSQILNLKLKSKVKLLGRIKNNQIPRFLSQADIFVRPSHHEGFGVAFIEAMAAKVPVIATPVGGIPDFVTHKKTGLLVPPKDPKKLCRAIKQLAANKQLKSSLVKNAYQLIKDKYQWDKISQAIEKAMIDLCH